MGVFDDIRCEYPLPLPADQGELTGRDWTKNLFQTKDLECSMGMYCIRPDGTLWFNEGSWGDDSDDGPWSRLEDFFGVVRFYDSIQGRTSDYWVEWKATFAEGKLNNLRLSEWRVEDNTERLRHEAEGAALADRRDRFLKTWTGRFVYPAYAWVVGLVLYNVVAGGANLLSTGFERLRTGAEDLESKLAPHGNPIAERARERRFRKQFLQGEGDDQDEEKSP